MTQLPLSQKFQDLIDFLEGLDTPSTSDMDNKDDEKYHNRTDDLDDDKFYLTTAIFYTNGDPHIGHAYEVITSDVLVRYHRIFGRNTYFLSGTDEHGQKVELINMVKKKTRCILQFYVLDTNLSSDDFNFQLQKFLQIFLLFNLVFVVAFFVQYSIFYLILYT